MAFVYRSSTRENFLDLKPLPLGPGEYDSEVSKTQAKIIHQNNMKYSKIIKIPKKPLNIPFNTTSQRSQIVKLDNYIPGPGAYTISQKEKNINNSFSAEKEISDMLTMGSKSSNRQGFLSSEKRFNSLDFKNSSNKTVSPGPGSYDLKTYFNTNKKPDNKFFDEKYAPNKGKMYSLPGSSDEKISSIPDKKKGRFKIIKGILTEIKNSDSDTKIKKAIGPGTYNLFQKWETNGLNWSRGYKKEEKGKINESKIQKELEQNSTMFNTETYSEKMHNFNASTISSTFKENLSKSKNTSSQLTKTMNINNISNNSKINDININGWNTATNLNYKNISLIIPGGKPQTEGLIRNKIFHNFLKKKEELHSETLYKQNFNNNLMLDVEYSSLPGPGFYDQNIIPRHTDFASTAQNFGSNSPKNTKIKIKNDILGPGTYFKEKNKYEPKFKTLLHIKFPEKQKRQKENSVYLENLIKKNKEKHPGPGEYNIEGELIKKEISNNKSFGSSVERFHGKEIKNKEDKNKNNVKVYINQFMYEENLKNENRNKKIKYLTKMEKAKKKEKQKRQPYVYKPIPAVGTYSPEITSTIYYNVFSKLNTYRNTVAPFNMINTRFSQIKNPRLEVPETPGPADYEVLPAFKALNLNKRKFNIFGQDEKREPTIRNPYVPGVGLYNLDNKYFWNTKSYNALFINK